MRFRNYKELCKALEIKDGLTGDSLKSQQKEVRSFIDYIQQKNMIIITEIYEQQKKLSKGGNKVYTDDFKALMIYMLNENETGQTVMSKSAIYKAMELVNNNYIFAKDKISQLAKSINLPNRAIYEFYDNSSVKLKSTIERNLKILRAEALIDFESVTAVAVQKLAPELDIYGNPVVDKFGNIIYKYKPFHRQATKEEKQQILRLERKVMGYMGLPNLQKVFLSGNWNTFKKEVEKNLELERSDIIFYYNAYCITWDRDDIHKEYNNLQLESEEVRESINEKICNSMLKTSRTKNSKAKNKTSSKRYEKERLEYQRSDNYLEEQEQLTIILMNRGAKRLNEKLDKK